MIWRTNFERMIGWLTTWGMNWLQTLVKLLLCERATLFTEPWLMFLRAPVTPAEPWSLSTGMADDLVDHLGHQLAQVRAVLPVVLRVVAVGDQVHPDEGVGVVAGDRVVAERGEIELELVAASGVSPPQRMSAGKIL